MAHIKQTTNLKDIILRSKNGDEDAYREIFEHLHGRVFSYVLSRSSGRDDALDITQTVFVDLWKGLEKFVYATDEEFYGFVFLIAKRKLGKYYRAQRNNVEFDERYITDNYEVVVEDYRHLMKLLDTLKPAYQELMCLRYWSGLSFAEIAEILSIREGTAKVWHHRSVKKLQRLYEKTLAAEL